MDEPVDKPVEEPSASPFRHISKRNIFIIVILVVVAIGIAYFLLELANTGFFKNIANGNPKFSILVSITHDEQDLNSYIPSPLYSYAIEIYNDTTACPKWMFISPLSSQPSYNLNNVKLSNQKNIDDYYGVYPFDFYVAIMYSNHTENNPDTYAEIVSRDFLNGTSNYFELPKVGEQFSVNFDVPILNYSAFRFWENKTENKLYAHYQLQDNWTDEGSYTAVCKFSRPVSSTSDNSMPPCNITSIVMPTNKQCLLTHCFNQTSEIIYIKNATINGKNFDCDIPMSVLNTDKYYSVRLNIYKQYSQELDELFQSQNSAPMIIS